MITDPVICPDKVMNRIEKSMFDFFSVELDHRLEVISLEDVDPKWYADFDGMRTMVVTEKGQRYAY